MSEGISDTQLTARFATLEQSITEAVEAVTGGGIIAYPTEAVFGIGCDPRNGIALQRIIDIKGRNTGKGFIVVASEQSQLDEFLAPIEPMWQQQFDRAWPGPVTFVVPAAESVSYLLSGHRDTLAVRVSSHPLVRQLCERCNTALVSTSANLSGEVPLRDAQAVRAEFGDALDAVVEGEPGMLASPTSMIDVRTRVRLR